MAFAVACWLALAGPMTQPAEAQQSRSLDDQLFDKLDSDPVDQFDRELLGPDKKQTAPDKEPRKGEDAAGSGGESLRARLHRELGAAAQQEDDNPLLTIARRMREVGTRIARSDPGADTQSQQEQIVADLDRLIQQARQRCAACKPSDKPSQSASRSPGGQPKPSQNAGGNKPTNKPAAVANAKPRGGEARHPDMQQMREAMKQLWGELPPRDREQMIQSPPEEFLPKYELLIEAYFRRLTEQKQDTPAGSP